MSSDTIIKGNVIINLNVKVNNIKCAIEGCNNLARLPRSKYCSKHERQIYRHGKILERTCNDSNEIIKYNNYAEVVLYNRKQEEIARTLIDLEDIDKISKYKWSLSTKKYARCESKKLFLHNLIMNITTEDNKNDKFVDHINGNPLDNRKSNLRILSKSENNFNKHIKVKGYYQDPKSGKYIASIKVKGKRIYLGRFINEEDAIKARKMAEEKYFPNIKQNEEEINT